MTKVVDTHQDHKGWTRVHGFFAVMGGFVSPDGKTKYSREDLEKLCVCEYPLITKDEIQDKSTADSVAKLFALVQTTWFMLQCVARLSQHLAITELELATVAFALLNMITYALWWDKPMDAQCPIRVLKKCKHCQEGRRNGASDKDAAGQTRSPEKNDQIEAHQRDKEPLPNHHSNTTICHPLCQNQDDHLIRFTVVPRPHGGSASSTPPWKGRDWRSSIGRCSWSNIRKPVAATFRMLLGPFNSMMGNGSGDTTFFIVGWKSDGPHENIRYLGSVFIATVFGAIHCMAWSFHFPTRAEQILWRISSLATASIPGVWAIVAPLIGFFLMIYEAHRSDAANFLIVFPLFLYAVGRIALLALCLMALRSPPPSSLQTVQWINFLPHV